MRDLGRELAPAVWSALVWRATIPAKDNGWSRLGAALTAIFAWLTLLTIYGIALDVGIVHQVAGAAVIALGPVCVAVVIGAPILRRLRRITQTPRALQIICREEDAAAGVRVTHGLISFFGKRTLPRKRLRLQDLELGGRVVQENASFYRLRVLPLISRVLPLVWMRSRNNETSNISKSPLTANDLMRALRRTAVLLVLVGPGWIDGGDALSSMSDPKNPLRVSIEAALALRRPIIPVLLTGATMPAPNQFPPTMREFARRNAAWIRDDPDYPGDMRRLTRVVEELTGLREEQPASATWIPLLLGALLSALMFIGIDALAIRQVLSVYNLLSQTTLIVMGGALLIVDLVIYGITDGLMTRWSGKRQNAAPAAMLGASLAMLAGVEELRLAHTHWSASLRFSRGFP